MTILNSKDAFMKKNKQLTIALSAFALTSLILLIVFYVSGVYPFGDRSLLKWDMELHTICRFFQMVASCSSRTGQYVLFLFEISRR